MFKKIHTLLGAWLLSLCLSLTLSAQTNLTGTVKDAYGDGLMGATVFLEETNLGTIANAQGQFLIQNVNAGNYTLVIQHIGYKIYRKTINIPSTESLTIELASDPLEIQGVVVSANFNPASKLSSSTAITTINAAQLNMQIPRGVSELIKAVPGMQVNNQFGEIGSDVTVRGLPTAANSSYRYISLREDGLPVFEAPGLVFAFPDAMFRSDETIDRMEAVRGGNAAIFSSNTPGGIVNFISKTGGNKFGGTARLSAGSQGLIRQDLAFGGPIGDKWRYYVGGYYRYDQGVRDAGFAANDGGQFKANLTRLLKNGYIGLHVRYLRERNVWYLGMPIQNYKNPETIPGGAEFGTGTVFSKDKVNLTIPDAFNRGQQVEKDLNGNTTDYKMIGLEFAKDLGGGWNLSWRNKYLQSENGNHLLIDVADPFPIAAFGAPGIPADVPRGIKYVNTGETITDPKAIAALNGNGLMSVQGMAFVHQPVKNLISQLQLSKEMAKHRLSAGAYFSNYTNDLQLTQHGLFLEVANRPKLIQVQAAVGPGGSFVGLTSPDGSAGYNTGRFNVNVDYTTAALYAGDEWLLSDKLTFDFGVRLNYNHVDGRAERPVIPGQVTNGQVVGQAVPIGYPAFTPTAEDTRNGQFGSGIYRNFDYSFNDWNASFGANYLLSENSAIYARFSRGTRAPTSQQWTFQTSNGSQVTGETNEGTVEEILQGEIGYKLNINHLAVLLTGFYSKSNDVITVLQRGQPDGSFKFLPIAGDARTVGGELELVVSPLRGLQLRSITTLQDPRYTRFEYDFFIPGVNQYSGTQKRDYSGNKTLEAVSFISDLTASYQRGNFDAFVNYRYTGSRYVNRPNTIEIPGYGEWSAGLGYGWRQFHFSVKGANISNTQAIVQMALRTGEDVIKVNADGSAVSIVTTGTNAGNATQSRYTTGSGILARHFLMSISYKF